MATGVAADPRRATDALPAVGAVRILHVATIDLTVRFLLLPQLLGLQRAGYDVAAMSAPGPWVEEVEAAGIRHVPWRSATRAWDPRADLRAFRELTDVLRRERPHLVHTHNAKPGVMGRIAGRVARVPCVVNTVHGFDAQPSDPPGRRLTFMGAEWFAARFSDLEFYQGAEDLDRARELHIVGRKKGRFLGNGTSLERFDPDGPTAAAAPGIRRTLGFSDADVVVGIIGRLVGEKGYRELFQVAGRIREQAPSVRFLALGDRDPAKDDAITDEEMRLVESDVTFAGWRRDVADVLAAMDVFVLPSWREGVPRSAIEAAAMGKPMVLSDIPGCRQVARHEREALLVPARNPEALEVAILRLVRDADLRRRLGRAARARALERFDENIVVDRILDGYRTVLARKGVAG